MKSEVVPARRFGPNEMILTLIGIIVTATALWLLYTYVPSLRLSLVQLVGRSECNLEQSTNAHEWNQRLAQRSREMQAGSSLVGKETGIQRWKTPRGEFWFPGGMPELFPLVLAEMALDVYGARRAIGPGYIVLDCGADFGAFTRLALESGAGRVVAIEGSPAKQQCLRRTFRKEIAEGRVAVYPKGVWNKDDQLTIQGGSVLVTTIDRIAQELGLTRIDVIKLDIEGAERNALRGAQNTLKQHRPKLLIASGRTDDINVLTSIARGAVPTYSAEVDNCQDFGNRVRALTLRLSSR